MTNVFNDLISNIFTKNNISHACTPSSCKSHLNGKGLSCIILINLVGEWSKNSTSKNMSLIGSKIVSLSQATQLTLVHKLSYTPPCFTSLEAVMTMSLRWMIVVTLPLAWFLTLTLTLKSAVGVGYSVWPAPGPGATEHAVNGHLDSFLTIWQGETNTSTYFF